MSKSKPYTPEENDRVAEMWVTAALAQIEGERFNKANAMRHIAADFPVRTRGSLDMKAMNMSAAAADLGLWAILPDGHVRGWKRLSSYQADCRRALMKATALVVIAGAVDVDDVAPSLSVADLMAGGADHN